MLSQWLKQLPDEAIQNWANKGLLRRGRKLAASGAVDVKPDALGESRIEGKVDGHATSLSAPAFAGLQCACPATGPCQHLIALLITLRDAANDQAEPANEAADDQSEPWLIANPAARQRALGKPAVDKAMDWLRHGAKATITQTHSGVSAALALEENFSVTMIAAGGVEGAVCSCHKERCAHIALVVLQLCADSGLLTIRGSAELDPEQRDLIVRLEAWLVELLGKGLVGLSSMQLDQGNALATELNQGGLTRCSRMLSALVTLAMADLSRQSVSSPARLREPIAAIWTLVCALKATRRPVPLHELTGEHRRSYHVIRGLELLTLGVEIWQTAAGFRGFSWHCLGQSDGKFYRYGESRAAGMDPTWDPREAWKSTMLGQTPLASLTDHRWQLEHGWLASGNRISGRQGTTTKLQASIEPRDWRRHCRSIATLRQKVAAELSENPVATAASSICMIDDISATMLTFRRHSQRFEGEAAEPGYSLPLVLDGNVAGRAAASRFNRLARDTTAMVVRYRLSQGRLEATPLHVVVNDRFVSVST